MKADGRTVTEFEKFSENLQRLQSANQLFQSGQTSEAEEILKTIQSALVIDEKECKDQNVKEALSLLAQVTHAQLAFTSKSDLSTDEQNEKLKDLKKVNANLQSKMLVIIAAVNAYKNPTVGNRFSAWIAGVADRFKA